jgi:hypothetical protein
VRALRGCSGQASALRHSPAVLLGCRQLPGASPLFLTLLWGRAVLALTVVTAEGEIVETRRAVRKSSTG